ncbi:MAG: protein-disulfide reductase DsbD [Ignavibacteriae bacterium]|nr:protein-disulfide reductase DsbD [Ignavibacteriota bacterium]NOG97469.1 protein-disulfide reductase DsbD [Ignavibacteriota bacterium]
MKNYLKILLVILFVFTNSFGQIGFDEELVEIEIYNSFDKIQAGTELKIAVKAVTQESWHINSNKPNEDYLIPTELSLNQDSPFSLSKVIYPKAVDVEFAFSDVPVSVYEGEVFIGGLINIPADTEPGEYKITVMLEYQGCNDISCMAPASVSKELTITVADNRTAINEINSEIFSQIEFGTGETSTEEDDSIGASLESSGLLLSLILVFLGGLALNLTPCVYPLIPITVGYFGGQSEGSTSKLFMLGILYVLGMALTYSVVGVITALSGAVFGALLQSTVVILGIVLVLLVLSLSMFGLYEFKLPDSWAAKAGGAKAGGVGALLMGLTMGIVAAPCIGPFVIGLVTYVAAKGDPYFGFLMFFVMALGLGLPYLVLALFSGKIKNLPRAGFWMDAVKKIFGFILIGMAIYFAGPILPKEVNTYLLPVFMIIAAAYLLIFDKSANNIRGFRIFKIIFSGLVIGAAVYMLYPVDRNSPAWQKFDEVSYTAALENNQKMIIDFYADWCIPCKELDALTFSDQRVIDLSKEFVTYKVDMTKTMSDETEKIREKFQIRGMPTVLVINTKGEEVERITGFVNADEFLNVISSIN